LIKTTSDVDVAHDIASCLPSGDTATFINVWLVNA